MDSKLLRRSLKSLGKETESTLNTQPHHEMESVSGHAVRVAVELRVFYEVIIVMIIAAASAVVLAYKDSH